MIKYNSEDVSTFSNFQEVTQTYLNFDFFIDFDKQLLQGFVDIGFLKNDLNAKYFILDLKFLEIYSIINKDTGEKMNYRIDTENPLKDALGTPLIIEINEITEGSLRINFTTTEASHALFWLEPEQTLSKKFPFVFSQCEKILARTMLPCQDTPSVKVPVRARLTVEEPLLALFSGLYVNQEKIDINGKNYTTFTYEQVIPIPSYLIAIAVGELTYKKLSKRCGVYSEPDLIERAAYELGETERMLEVAETYLTPYIWGEYNVLVLPPGFMYGGMENPCLTFVNHAIIAGDRSMVNILAHEISHSWTGNLVTNKDWGNFWVNEGFTTFMEKKISEIMNGEDMSNLEGGVGMAELRSSILEFGENHNYTKLQPDLRNVFLNN